jgi:DNA polymerase V
VDYLVKNPASTLAVRAQGETVIGADIEEGDLLIVDKTLTPHSESVVLIEKHDRYAVKRMSAAAPRLRLVTANPQESI